MFLLFSITVLIFPSPITARSATLVIEITPNGFEPSEITVEAGNTVIFTNKDIVDRWPASNIHPTHELYPEFDPKKSIPPSSSWNFIPHKTGVWRFHDHLFPHKRGVLTVVSEQTVASNPSSLPSSLIPRSSASVLPDTQRPSLVSQIVEFLKNLSLRLVAILWRLPSPPAGEIAGVVDAAQFKELPYEEQQAALINMATNKGVFAVRDFLFTAFKGESGTSGSIHDLAHLTGHLLYKEFGISGINHCPSIFAFGCFHGFLDTAFEKDLADLPHAVKGCEGVGTPGSGPYASCIHGIGHGIASFYQVKELKSALNTCKEISQGKEFCYDGVFMEFERDASSEIYPAQSPLSPCTEIDEEFKFACARNQPMVLLGRHKKSFAEVSELCITAPHQKIVAGCVDALGFLAAGNSAGNATKVLDICKLLKKDEYIAQCAQAAAGEFIFQETPGWQSASPLLCNSVPNAFIKTCHEYINHLIRDYGRKPLSINLKPYDSTQSKSGYVREQMSECYKIGGRDDCYQQVGELFAHEFGLKETLTLFKINEAYPEVFARCHEVTHYLSRAEYDKRKDVPQVYAQCDSTCHGGCYHGTLEAYLNEKKLSLTDNLTKDFSQVCGKLKDYTSPLIYFECLHGLGHAALYVHDMEAPQALALCDVLDSIDNRERCYSGVFMENSSSSTNTDHPGKYVRANDPYYPCNSLSEQYQKLCYRYQSSYFALITNHNWAKVAELCLGVPFLLQNECFVTVGTNQVGFTQDQTRMRQNCELMPTDHARSTCIMGVIIAMSYRYVGDMTRMINFCSETKYQQNCFRQIGVSVADWSKNSSDRISRCNQIQNPNYRSWCLGA